MKKFFQTFPVGRELWFILLSHLSMMDQINLYQAVLEEDSFFAETVQEISQDWLKKEEKKCRERTLTLLPKILEQIHIFMQNDPVGPAILKCYHKEIMHIEKLTNNLKAIYKNLNVLKRFCKNQTNVDNKPQDNNQDESRRDRSYVFATQRVLFACFHFFNFDEEFFNQLESQVLNITYAEQPHYCLAYQENVCINQNCFTSFKCRKPKWKKVIRYEGAEPFSSEPNGWWNCREKPGMKPNTNVIKYSRIHVATRVVLRYRGKLHIELWN